MMQGIVSRGRGLPGGVDGEVVHSAITLSSARSLPVRGQRGGAWTAWEELASLADADADDARMAASQLPPARGPGRNPAAGLARTLYGDLESSRSENARAFCAPQPRSAWAEAPGRSSASALPPQPSARHAPAEALEDTSTGGPGAAWAGLRASPLTTRSAHSVPRSASPAHRAPSPQLRASVQTNEIAMAQGTEDFLSASQGFLREYNRLARLGLAQGNLRIAEENLTQALELVQQGQMSSTPVAAVTYNLLGCMCRRMGRLNEAVDYLHRSLDVLAARRNGAEPVVERDIDLADVHMNMSSAQSALNRHDAALLHVETAIALLSDRLGMGERPDLQGVASEQDSKDVRMLVIAHYNRGAEMRTLNQHTGSLQAFDTAMQLADSFLPPGDSLLSMIKKAQRRARGGQTAAALPDRMGAPPGVTPLRLSMLQQESSHSVLQLASSAADQGAPERRKREASTLETASHRSMSSMASRRSPRSGRSQLTPQGWHNLHAVHCGNFASSARRSARDGGGGAGVEASRQPRVNFTDTHVQTGLVPVSQQAEMRATLPRNVFQRKHAAWRGTDGDTAEVELDENDEVLGLAQEHDIFALIRAAPDASVVKVASRYVPQSDKTRGLLDYGHSLTRSLIKTKEMCESGTQVEQEYMDAERGAGGGGEGGHFVRLKSLPGGWRRENVELTVEDMVSQRAREELRGRGSERASSALRAGSVDTSEAGRRQGASLDRTYRSHLQRTREAHLRFNRVALTLQKAYRCHLARGVATELLRNPRHLKAMLAKQIHAFASLLQSNIRCMLAKRHVAKRASLRIMSAEDRWRARRNRAAYVIQAWFWGVIGSRLVAKRHSGPPAAAACVQRAYRSHLAR
jgi:tetratricopeptide (TPR) repeat protein